MKRSALLIGLDKKGDKILLHHKSPDAPTNANLWVLIGGSIEPGEETVHAVIREVLEEFDVQIKPFFFKKYSHEETWGIIERYIFYATVPEPLQKLRLAQREGDDLGFFSLEEMARLTLNKNHFRIIDEFLKSDHYKQFRRTNNH